MAYDKNGDGKVTREELPERMWRLIEMGAPLTPESYGTTVPRRGMMRV